jgi:hypothetical protein
LTEPALSEMSAFPRAGGPDGRGVDRVGQRERDRLRVLHEVEQGHLKQREAGARLRLSEGTDRAIFFHRADRLVKEMRPAGIDTLDGANRSGQSRPADQYS